MPAHKRSFDEFAEPHPRFKWGMPYLHNNKPDGTPRRRWEPIKPNMKPLYNHITRGVADRGFTVKNLIDHGMDPERYISDLTNEIHPIFNRVCRCKFTRHCFCLPTETRVNYEKKQLPVQVPEIASPHPSDNVIVRTIMRLATRLITSDDALPFWSAVMDCGIQGKHIHASPRKRLSEERKQVVLQRLRDLSRWLVIHFREFSHTDDAIVSKPLLAFTAKRRMLGVPIAGIIMNVEGIDGYNLSAQRSSCEHLNVYDLRRSIIRNAVYLCHELAHAFVYLETRSVVEPRFNDEPFVEAGHAFENFIFGGTFNSLRKTDGLWLQQWPVRGRLNGYKHTPFRREILAPIALPKLEPQWVSSTVYMRFLTD